MSTPSTVAAPAPPVSWRHALQRIDNRLLPPILITCILITAHLNFGILEAYGRTALAIVTAIATELILGRITYGTWLHPASAYISGISVGILVRSPFLWPYFFASFISILSKYVLRVKGRHLWNPSNLGVSAVLFLAPQTVSLLSIQWGNNLWPMAVIWLLGFAIVWRVGRLHVSASYVVAFLVFALIRSAITGNPWQSTIAPITGPMYQLFIFFMVTDPKVGVRSKLGQVVVVVLVAFVEMLLRLNEVIYAPFYALFLVGPSALLVEMALGSKLKAQGSGKSSLGS
jgi:Na+-translocating ferredoxin:NAD+ oxidoreductase RnfD subunit